MQSDAWLDSVQRIPQALCSAIMATARDLDDRK
jgi:hypothetical protein